jgi:xanthine dehydrogenase accessory factor
MTLFDELRRTLVAEQPAVLFTVLEGPRAGAKLLVTESGDVHGEGPAGLAESASELLARGRGRIVEHEGVRVFADVFGPPPRLVVFGAVDTAEALCAAAKAIGWATLVSDARARFATPERLPSAGQIVVAWPDEALERIRPDRRTAVVCLSHEERFDVPALAGALASDAFYIGALGSRRTQAKRRARLAEAGVPEADIERIHGPCGLDIGAETPAETALSIMAEVLAVRAGRSGVGLARTSGRIHAEPPDDAVRLETA